MIYQDEINSLRSDTSHLVTEAQAILDELGDAPVERKHALLTEDDVAPVSVQRRSANPKLAPQRVVIANSGRKRYVPAGPYVVSTYASIIATCPHDCRFFGNGCYAEAGQAHLVLGRLNRAATKWSIPWSALETSFAEADAIARLYEGGVPRDGARGGRDLRLHVSGDVSCHRGAVALGVVAGHWRARGGGRVWTYTHRWQEIRRSAWSAVSALASVETAEEAELAIARGYVPALVVPRFPHGHKAFALDGSRTMWVPCPVEAGAGTTCATCRLCLDDDDLRRRNLGIVFAVHGSDAAAARRRLPVVG